MCIFCEYLKDKNKIILENELAFAIYDQYPVSKGHMLILPKRHEASYFKLTDYEKKAVDDLLNKAKLKLDITYKPDGYNIGINDGKSAGQTVFHCHLHLIPRYEKDMLDPKGGVRVSSLLNKKYK